MIALIIGYGSIGRRHYQIAKKSKKFKRVYIYTKQKISEPHIIKKLIEIDIINPDYIVVCNETTKHYFILKYLEKKLTNKKILIEKPLFEKFKKIQIKKNRVFVGYNLRFDPMIDYLRSMLKRKKVILLSLNCDSYLPKWRKNIHYSSSSSAKKISGGGIDNDLSHEFDLIYFLTGDYKILSGTLKKLSNLKINTPDYLLMQAKNSLCKQIHLHMNIFNFLTSRKILVITGKSSIEIDLINRKIIYSNKKHTKKINFLRLNRNFTYEAQMNAILKNADHKLCNLEKGLFNLKKMAIFRKKCQLFV